MISVATLLSIPFIAIASIPLLSFAAFTTSLAFATLLIRVSVVYVELALALLQSALSPSSSKAPARPIILPLRSPVRSEPPKVGHHRRGSASSATPPPSTYSHNRNSSYASLVGIGPSRDYEGVGGWRLTSGEDQEEEATWMGMNSRLELPALSIPSPATKKHMRSLTSGSQKSPMLFENVSPEIGRSPGLVRNTGRLSGTASPEGYFGTYASGEGGGWRSEAASRRASVGSRSGSISVVKLQELT